MALKPSFFPLENYTKIRSCSDVPPPPLSSGLDCILSIKRLSGPGPGSKARDNKTAMFYLLLFLPSVRSSVHRVLGPDFFFVGLFRRHRFFRFVFPAYSGRIKIKLISNEHIDALTKAGGASRIGANIRVVWGVGMQSRSADLVWFIVSCPNDSAGRVGVGGVESWPRDFVFLNWFIAIFLFCINKCVLEYNFLCIYKEH